MLASLGVVDEAKLGRRQVDAMRECDEE